MMQSSGTTWGKTREFQLDARFEDLGGPFAGTETAEI
jgi:hypothetical protein